MKMFVAIFACAVAAAAATKQEDADLSYSFLGSIHMDRHPQGDVLGVSVGIMLVGSEGNASGIIDKTYRTPGKEYDFSIAASDLGTIEKIRIVVENENASSIKGYFILHNMTLMDRGGKIKVYAINKEVRASDKISTIDIEPNDLSSTLTDQPTVCTYHVTIRVAVSNDSGDGGLSPLMHVDPLTVLLQGKKGKAQFIINMGYAIVAGDLSIPYVLKSQDLGCIQAVYITPDVERYRYSFTIKQIIIAQPDNKTVSLKSPGPHAPSKFLLERMYNVEIVSSFNTLYGLSMASLKMDVVGSTTNLTTSMDTLGDAHSLEALDVEAFCLGEVQLLQVEAIFFLPYPTWDHKNFSIFVEEVRLTPKPFGVVDGKDRVVFNVSTLLTMASNSVSVPPVK